MDRYIPRRRYPEVQNMLYNIKKLTDCLRINNNVVPLPPI